MICNENWNEELKHIEKDACAGKLTETKCQNRLNLFKKEYADGILVANELGDIKNQPASKKKLNDLKYIGAAGSTSEELFLEMARTGRALRKRKLVGTVASIAAIVAVIAAIISIISFFKGCRKEGR